MLPDQASNEHAVSWTSPEGIIGQCIARADSVFHNMASPVPSSLKSAVKGVVNSGCETSGLGFVRIIEVLVFALMVHMYHR
jgi:hypothetical protein